MTALALAGWLLAFCGAWRALVLHRRLELVASAEHELRGPLAALTLAAGARPFVASAVLEAQLERTRPALGDLAAARAGGPVRPRVQRLPLRALAERAAEGWRGAGGEVSFDWRAGPATVQADPERVSQALGNLLSNAIEHGGGRVAVRGLRAGERVRIEIEDRGPGFSARRGRGRGRGLRIAARAVEEAGGELRLRSSPDGATASVELPLADA